MGTRLYRSRRGRMLAGVAGGLAEVWGADPALIRIIWALLVVFTGGLALVVYIVMAIVVPEEEEVYPGGVPGRMSGADTSAPGAFGAPGVSRTGGLSAGVLVGGFLVLLGGFFLIREFLPRIDFDWFWPLILVALGIVLIVSAMGRGPRASAPPTPPPPPAAPPPPTESPPPPAESPPPAVPPSASASAPATTDDESPAS